MFPPVRVTFSLNDSLGGCGNPQRASSAANGQPQQQQQQPPPLAQQLNPREKYQVLMDILPYDNKRYRYAYHKSSWQQAGKADPPSPTKLFLHPDGPFTLDQLKRQVISFEKIKLTNNDANKHGHIVLNSMHKYQPRIHLVLWRGGKESQHLANAPISLLDQETHKTFIFSETIFTAVTAYQNHSITKLKIDSNPFAKGFRDSSRLTDLELESMQDLMSEGQCPFSPPRAPPHGFPHFLFAAAQQSPGPHGMEDPASALLRERTIMALDSFLQQQQQHQHQQQQHNQQQPPQQQHRSSQGSPQQRPLVPQPQHQQANATPTTTSATLQSPHHPQGPYGGQHFLGSGLGSPHPPAPGSGSGPATGQSVSSSQLEQLIMQQQQQLAAAAMAAAAAANHHQWFAQLPPPPPPYAASVGGPGSGSMLGHGSPNCTTPTGGQASGKPTSLGGGPGSPVRACQLSPVSAAKSAAEQQLCFHGGPPGGAPSLYSGNPSSAVANNSYAAAAAAAAAAAGFHPQHLQAVMAAHHQHQMAALSMQLDNHKAGIRPQQQQQQQLQFQQQQLGQLGQLQPQSAHTTSHNKK